MQNRSIYDTLLELPLFKGVSRVKISEIVGLAKFHFLKFEPGTQFVQAGAPCTHLVFVLAGKVRMTTRLQNSAITVGQTLTGPSIVSPDFLFGMKTTYPFSVTAIDTASVVQLSKSDYLKILNADQVCLLNSLNYLSMNAQKPYAILSIDNDNAVSRFAFFVMSLTLASSTEIEISCSVNERRHLFGATEAQTDEVLHRLKTANILEYDQETIKIKSRRALLETLESE